MLIRASEPKENAMEVTVSKNEFIEYANSIGMKILSIDDDTVCMDVEPAPLRAPVPNPMEPKFQHLAGGAISKDQQPQPGLCRILMLSPGPQKISVIKVIRSFTGLGLLEAKLIVDTCPSTVISGIPLETANIRARELREAGATVAVEPL